MYVVPTERKVVSNIVYAGTFTFRLSRPEPGQNRVVSEARVASGLAPRTWTCLALNVKELVYKRHIYIQVCNTYVWTINLTYYFCHR